MTIQLQSGVRLHLISTDKYKTTRIFLRFSTRHNKTSASKRTLLTSLLETNSLHYPSQTALSTKLADLYGASFGMDVGKKGNIHQINMLLSFVNGKYIGEEQIFNQGIEFLHSILFYPNIKENQFDGTTFKLEKANTIAYLKSVEEDKQALASLNIQSLYFDQDDNQKTPSFGTVEDMEKVTNEELVETYQEMLANDQVDIFVVGDITEAQVKTAFKEWVFPQTQRAEIKMFYHQDPVFSVKKKTKYEDVMQAKLNLGYQTNTYYDDDQRLSLMVFNGLFGGYPHSKLFLNVREKESLAYYASSSFDSFRGFMTVQTGIDGKNKEKVLALINQQLESIRQGDFTEVELEQTKTMLKNDYLLSLDNAQSLIERAYLNTWLPEVVDDEEEFLSRLQNVTKEDVQQLAKKISLQAIFFLDAEGKK